MLDPEFAALESEAWIALLADAWSEYVMVRGILNHVADQVRQPPTDTSTAALGLPGTTG
jgi:hypothetical protein